MQTMEAHVAALEGTYKQVADRLTSIDGRLNRMDGRLDELRGRVDALGDELRSRMDRQFLWTLGVVAASGAAIAGVMISAMQAVVNVARALH